MGGGGGLRRSGTWRIWAGKESDMSETDVMWEESGRSFKEREG